MDAQDKVRSAGEAGPLGTAARKPREIFALVVLHVTNVVSAVIARLPIPCLRSHALPRVLSRRDFSARVGVSLVGMSLLMPAAFAAAELVHRAFDVPRGPAGATLKQFVQQAGEQVLYSPDDIAGVETQPVRGQFTSLAALERMLQGTGLKARQDLGTNAIAITRAPRAPAETAPNASARNKPERSTTMPNQNQRSTASRTLLAALGGWLALGDNPARAAQSGGATTAETDVVTLSPFIVDTSQDRGYQAANTLSGSRLNTPLTDTPASVSVFTPEFLQDIGRDDLSQIVAYSVNADIYRGDETSVTLGNEVVNAVNTARRIDIRGVQASQAFDYFKSITTDDSYRVGRYDENRGPNSILFGISSVGGLINQTSKTANLGRTRGQVKYSFGSYDRNRSELDWNQVLRPQRLAYSVAAVHQENGGWRQYDHHDKDRIFGSVVFKPAARLTITAMAERGIERRALLSPFTVADEGLAWLDNRNARGASAVTFAPLNNNPSASQQALGIVLRSSVANGANHRPVYIENNSVTFDSVGTFITGSYNNSAVRSPDGIPGVTGGQLKINDPSFLPYSVSVSGPGMFHRQSLHNYTVTADWELTNRLFVNVGHNFQASKIRAYLIPPPNPTLKGDPNTTTGVGGPANPYAGQLLFEGNWKIDRNDAEREETRVTSSYEIKAGALGEHRLAGMLSHSRETFSRVGAWLGLLGTGFQGGISGVNNRIIARAYVDERNLGSFRAPDWQKIPATLTLNNNSYPVAFLNDEPGSNNSSVEQQIDSGLLVAQSRFFAGRLVTTLGYRRDKAKSWQFGHARDSTGQAVPDFDRTKATTARSEGETRTAGVVLHVTRGVSAVANTSSNIGVPDYQRLLLPDGRVPSPSKGSGLDVGLQFEFLQRRLTAKAVYFETTEEGAATQNAVPATFGNPNTRIMDAFASVLAGSGRVYSAADWAPIYARYVPNINSSLYDTDSHGYEFSAVANPTPQWRFVANYSYTYRRASNTYYYDVVPWYGFKLDERGLITQGVRQAADGRFVVDPSAFSSDGVIARWLELASKDPGASISTLVTAGNRTVAQEIYNTIEGANEFKSLQEQRWGLRPHKVSLFTAYDFTRGRLKGFTVGGGVRWQSRNVIGANTGGSEMQGRELREADLMVRYHWRRPAGFLDGNLILQGNVTNLFNESGIIPKYLSSSPDFVVPGGRGVGYSRFDLIDPRAFRFTATYEF